MAVKRVVLPDIGEVALYKRKGTQQIRISIAHNGEVKVSMPSWVPYAAGVQFAVSRKDWIESKRPAQAVLYDGMRIGKAHTLRFVINPDSDQPRSTRKRMTVTVSHPPGLPPTTKILQTHAEKAGIRALKFEAKSLLPQRLQQLATQHGFSYQSVDVKTLSGRWGSCSAKQEITLNCYLMELPWNLIDYVLLHELTHTRIMAHGPLFWAEMRKYLPQVQELRATIKQYRPIFQNSIRQS